MTCECKFADEYNPHYMASLAKKQAEFERMMYNDYYKNKIDLIDHVVFNGPATIIFFKDGTKTVIKCHDEDTLSIPTGFALALLKKILGGAAYHKLCNEWLDDVYAAEKERIAAKNKVEEDKKPRFETRSRLDILEEEIAELKKELGK